MRTLLASLLLLTCSIVTRAADAPVRRVWMVDGVERVAMVSAPDTAKEMPSPLMFVFHGHGGRMEGTARRYDMRERWPEAIVVCPQGVNSPGMLSDPEGKRPGWQFLPGQRGDRDLKFFDAMLADLKRDYRVDEKRVYVTGHSNGGAFTYLLWAVRGDVFAAVAPTAAAIVPELKDKLTPKPALHLAGENDKLVKFEWQQAAIKTIRELNRCGEGEPWGQYCTLYPSKLGTPVVAYIHPGAHNFPEGAEVVIARFFKEHARP